MYIYNFFQTATIVQDSGTVFAVRSVVLVMSSCGHLNVPVAATLVSQRSVVLLPQAVNATFRELKDVQFLNISE